MFFRYNNSAAYSEYMTFIADNTETSDFLDQMEADEETEEEEKPEAVLHMETVEQQYGFLTR